MKLLSLIFAICLSASAFAAYDSSWYQTEFWSGEYPMGFSVVKENVSVMARAEMDLDAPANIACALPYRAVFQVWNTERNEMSKAHYFTASKIVTMTAKEDFDFETTGDLEHPEYIHITKGEEIEYLIYGSEGSFLVRIRGQEYTGDQSLFEKLEEIPSDAFHEDEWLQLTCEGGNSAWIFANDLMATNERGETSYIDGLSDMGPGLEEYGRARDLTEEEARSISESK